MENQNRHERQSANGVNFSQADSNSKLKAESIGSAFFVACPVLNGLLMVNNQARLRS